MSHEQKDKMDCPQAPTAEISGGPRGEMHNRSGLEFSVRRVNNGYIVTRVPYAGPWSVKVYANFFDMVEMLADEFECNSPRKEGL